MVKPFSPSTICLIQLLYRSILETWKFFVVNRKVQNTDMPNAYGNQYLQRRISDNIYKPKIYTN